MTNLDTGIGKNEGIEQSSSEQIALSENPVGNEPLIKANKAVALAVIAALSAGTALPKEAEALGDREKKALGVGAAVIGVGAGLKYLFGGSDSQQYNHQPTIQYQAPVRYVPAQPTIQYQQPVQVYTPPARPVYVQPAVTCTKVPVTTCGHYQRDIHRHNGVVVSDNTYCSKWNTVWQRQCN